jgi:cytochrome c biogenesis protein CcdA
VRRIGRGLRVAGAVSLGFVAVFGVAGIAITQASITVQTITPWISIVVGLTLVPVGVAMALGWQPSLSLPAIGGREGHRDDRGLLAMAWFGASFATVSLSCTIPAFLVAVASTFEEQDLASGMTVFLAYTAGMAAVLGTLTVAMALAQGPLVARVRRVLPDVQRTAGALLTLAGAYVAYYGWYDIRLEQGRDVPTGPVDAVGAWSGQATEWVDGLGNGPVVAVGVVLVAAMVLAAVSGRRRPGSRTAPRTARPAASARRASPPPPPAPRRGPR